MISDGALGSPLGTNAYLCRSGIFLCVYSFILFATGAVDALPCLHTLEQSGAKVSRPDVVDATWLFA